MESISEPVYENLPEDWDIQVIRAYQTFGHLDGADEFGFLPRMSIAELREKAEKQLRDAAGRWRDMRGRIGEKINEVRGRRDDSNDSAIEAWRSASTAPFPRNKEGAAIPDLYKNYKRDADGRAILSPEELGTDFLNPKRPSTMDRWIEDSTDENGNPVKVLNKDREMLHRELAGRILDCIEARDFLHPHQTFLGGGSGAGKGTATKQLPGYPKVRELDEYKPGCEGDSPTAALLDSDALKTAFPEWGKPDLEHAAAFAHEESSFLMKKALAVAQERRLDIVLDGTGDGKVHAMKAKIQQADKEGYSTSAIYVTVPTKEGIVRAIVRGLVSKKLQSEGVKGRLVLPTMVSDIHGQVSGIFPHVKNDFGRVDLYDANVPYGKTAPAIISNGETKDQGKLDAFLAKADEDTLENLQDALAWAKNPQRGFRDELKSKGMTGAELRAETIRLLEEAILAEKRARAEAAAAERALSASGSGAIPTLEGESPTVDRLNVILQYVVNGVPPEDTDLTPIEVIRYYSLKYFIEGAGPGFIPDTAHEFADAV